MALALRKPVLLAIVLAGLAPLAGCRAVEPTNKTVAKCLRSCESHASRQCSSSECERGCEFILDRLVEREADNVISCVSRAPRRCSDVVWAECAASIGVHVDGGPPAPPPPAEDWE